MKRGASLLLVAVSAVGLVACGSGSGRLSKGEYERAMRSIQPVLDSSLRDFQPTDFEHVATYVAKLGDEIAGVAAKLAAMHPPPDVEALHAQLADGATKAAKAFRDLAGELEGRSVAEVQDLLRQFDSRPLREALAEMQAARDAIAARGYAISSSAGT